MRQPNYDLVAQVMSEMAAMLMLWKNLFKNCQGLGSWYVTMLMWAI